METRINEIADGIFRLSIFVSGVSLNDMADRAPHVLANGETIDLGGGKRIRYIDTPHTPHGWDAGVIHEESTGTLLCGDRFTQLSPRALALMHGPSFSGDGGAALPALADDYDRRAFDARLAVDRLKAA